MHKQPVTTQPDFTGSQRFEALAYYFGWQGGTIHQLEAETGVSGLLSMPCTGSHGDMAARGWFGVRTCCLAWRRDRLAPQYRGNVDYWRGVINGYWATGALGGAEFSSRFGNVVTP